jgi:hypothetical protein
MNRCIQYPTRSGLSYGELLRLPFQAIIEAKTYPMESLYPCGSGRMPMAEQEITA